MINRRIILFGLIVVLGLTVLSFGKKIINDKMIASNDEIEVVRSDASYVDAKEDDDGMRKTVLYFRNGEGYLVPLMRKIPWEEGIARSAINNMIDSPELREILGPIGLEPILPAGTQILGMTVDSDTRICRIDLSENVVDNNSEKEEEGLIKGVVYTLTEFPAIDEVQILIGGKSLPSLKFGTDISRPIARKDINLIGKEEEGRSTVLVYYKGMDREEYEYFIPVTIPTLAPQTNVYSALDVLFDGPPLDSGLYSDLPRDITLHGVEVKDGVAYVDISYDSHLDPLDDVFGDIIRNIGLTLGQFEEIETVELLIDGEIINSTIPVFANEY